jgi:hypothetical protein
MFECDIYNILGSHGVDYENCCFVECDAMYFGRDSIFKFIHHKIVNIILKYFFEIQAVIDDQEMDVCYSV